MAAAPHHDANGAQIGTHETTPAAPGAASAAPSTAAHADADAAAAATRALYDTEAYAQTELVSSIPPPSLDFLRALVERDGQHSRNVPSPSPVPVLFRSDARAPHEAAVSWLVRGGGGDVAEVWRGHELVVVQPAAPVDYSQFCFADLVEQLFAAKRRLPELSKDQFAKSRDMANPHELVGKSVFLNRSAVKLASLDAQLRLVHGALARTGGSARVDFVDLCAGPGGFTEYLVWRAATHDAGAATPVVATTPPSSSSSSITATTAAAAAASPWTQVRGWGMTLRGDQDFQTDAMVVPPTGEQLTPVYGADGTGDMYNSDNIREMARVVMEATGGVGVHLVVADGGFSVAGDELYHEEHTAQLILCQIAGMFHVLRKGGTFVLKTFDLFTPLSVELVYILHLHFERIAIVKPVPSRPANSERYIICENLEHAFPADVLAHLHTANAALNRARTSTAAPVSAHTAHQPGFATHDERIALGLATVTDVLDRAWVLSDERFVDYIQASNMKLAVRQREAVLEILRYAGVEGDTPLPFDQSEIRARCLAAWGLPAAPAPTPAPAPAPATVIAPAPAPPPQQQHQYSRGRDDRHVHQSDAARHARDSRFAPYQRRDDRRDDRHRDDRRREDRHRDDRHRDDRHRDDRHRDDRHRDDRHRDDRYRDSRYNNHHSRE
ncbi:hypothetical protein HK105_204703 [Polyrhizophydium stewartii]|uniref:Cap-specific mRNA (nucleoside-2'-O-)-methyltransferase 1 n=1 Tax=Polyrhizophydium stewartii TaxID=2732419 RepID=A0ABR4N8A0_9FUNG